MVSLKCIESDTAAIGEAVVTQTGLCEQDASMSRGLAACAAQAKKGQYCERGRRAFRARQVPAQRKRAAPMGGRRREAALDGDLIDGTTATTTPRVAALAALESGGAGGRALPHVIAEPSAGLNLPVQCSEFSPHAQVFPIVLPSHFVIAGVVLFASRYHASTSLTERACRRLLRPVTASVAAGAQGSSDIWRAETSNQL